MNDIPLKQFESLYSPQQSIRAYAESLLNQYFKDLESFRQGLDLIYNNPETQNEQIQLQIVIYLRNRIQYFMYALQQQGQELESYFLNQTIIPSLSISNYTNEIIAYIVYQTLPESIIMERLSNLEYYNLNQLQLIRSILKYESPQLIENQLIKITQILQNTFQQIQVSEIPLIYLEIIRINFNGDEIFLQLYKQIYQILQQHKSFHEETTLYYLKTICKYLKQKTFPNEAICQDLFSLMIKNYVQTIYRLTSVLQLKVENYVMKIFNHLIKKDISQLFQTKQDLLNFFNFILYQGIIGDEEFYKDQMKGSIIENKNFRVNLRQNTIKLLQTLCEYQNSECIFQFILMEIANLSQNYEKMICQNFEIDVELYFIMEGYYTALNQVLKTTKYFVIQDKTIKRMRERLTDQNPLFIPVQIAILNVMQTLIDKRHLSEVEIQIYAHQLINSMQYHQSIQFCLLSLKSAASLINRSHELKEYLNSSKQILPLLQQYYNFNNIRIKKQVLLIYIQLQENVELIISLISEELKKVEQLQDLSSVKSIYKMILIVIINLVQNYENWEIYIKDFLFLIQKLYNQKMLQDSCSECLYHILSYFIGKGQVQFENEIIFLFQNLQISIQKYYDQESDFLVLCQLILLNIYNQDLMFKFIQDNYITIARTEHILMISLIMHHQERKIEELILLFTQIKSTYSKIIKFDKLYTEIIVWITILYIRGFDHKQILFKISEQHEKKQYLEKLIQGAHQFVQLKKDYYLNYYSIFLLSNTQTCNIEFDFQQLNLGNNQGSTFYDLIKTQYKELKYIYHGAQLMDYIEYYFNKHFRSNLVISTFTIAQNIKKKYYVSLADYANRQLSL